MRARERILVCGFAVVVLAVLQFAIGRVLLTPLVFATAVPTSIGGKALLPIVELGVVATVFSYPIYFPLVQASGPATVAPHGQAAES